VKAVFLDFEYNDSTEAKLNLVSVAASVYHGDDLISREVFWLHKTIKEKKRFSRIVDQWIEEDYYFVAYNVIAEGRSLLSLPTPFDIVNIKWIDLWLEYRNLLNHNNKLSYGKQLIEGKVVTTFPPKPVWQQDAAYKKESHDKPSDGLAACCFKLLGVKIDTDRKEAVRDLIISKPKTFTPEEREEICEYNLSDIDYLKQILDEVLRLYGKNYPRKYRLKIKEWMLSRGNFAARTAVQEKGGYPINYQHTLNFSKSVGDILGEIQGEINELFPDVKPFDYNLRKGLYKWSHVRTKEWIRTLPPDIVSQWTLTKGKDLSLSLDAFTEFFDFKHNYPKDNLGAQFVRFLKTKQGLNGFTVASSKSSSKTPRKTLWDYVGRDKWVRPYTNIYRSQSSRNQPSATSFMFLKAAWMRSLVQPPSGYAMGGIDYGSEEFLIAGLESGDTAMIEAYHSGDVYLWFGKKCKKIPQNATKKTHGKLRDRFKSSVLGIQYQMAAKSLALKIQNDTGEPCTEEQAQEFIDMFNNIFWRYSEYRDFVIQEYYNNGYLILDDGWTMWGDNSNFRSIANCPIQGKGAVIMRKFISYGQDAGLTLPLSLHDAGYVLFPSEEIWQMDTLADCMQEAFRDSFPDRDAETCKVRLDGSIWSPDYPKEECKIWTPAGMELKRQQIYVDDRSIDEYNKFKKYFDRELDSDLL